MDVAGVSQQNVQSMVPIVLSIHRSQYRRLCS